MLEFLHQDIGRRKDFEGAGKGHWHVPRCKVMLESEKIFGFVTKIELLVHHFTEYVNLFGKRYPPHSGKKGNDVGKERHDGKITFDHFGNPRVEDFYCN